MGCCQAPARDPSAAVSPPSKRRRLEAGAVSASPAIAAPLADAQTDRQQQQEQQQPPQQPLQPQQPQLPKHLQQPRQQLNEQHPRQQVLQSRENLPQLWQPQEQEKMLQAEVRVLKPEGSAPTLLQGGPPSPLGGDLQQESSSVAPPAAIAAVPCHSGPRGGGRSQLAEESSSVAPPAAIAAVPCHSGPRGGGRSQLAEAPLCIPAAATEASLASPAAVDRGHDGEAIRTDVQPPPLPHLHGGLSSGPPLQSGAPLQDIGAPAPRPPPGSPRQREEPQQRRQGTGTAETLAPPRHRPGVGNAGSRSDTAPPVRRSRARDQGPGRLGEGSAVGPASAAAPLLPVGRLPQRPPQAPPELQRPTAAEGAEGGSSSSMSGGGEAAAAGEGESWERFLNRAKDRSSGVADAPLDLFEAFRTSDDLGLTFASFARLFRLASQGSSDSPWGSAGSLPYERLRVLLGGNWKAKKLWEKLDKRSAKPEFADSPCGCGRLGGRRIVVVGGGPCGLYAAIALRLLGAAVTVVERRQEFSRINQLHIWPWCGEEIKELGARCLEPPPPDFGANPDLLSIGISDLQVMLLKTALLFGVEILLGTEFKQIVFASGTWTVRLAAASPGPPSGPSPGPPTELRDVGAVVGTDGGAVVGEAVGIQTVELGSLRAEDAIGLVCNFATMSTAGARKLRSFALASQFYGPLFRRLSEATGAELENIVFTKSKGSYYFVMTPTRRCLAQCGVLRDPAHKPLIARENVDRAALEAFCRRVVGFRLKEGEPTLQEVADEAVAEGAPAGAEGCGGLGFADRGPQLFDFSKLRRAAEGLAFLEPPPGAVAGRGADEVALPVLLAGDALLEPFWPEGLGIVRGFLSSLDVCSTLVRWSGGASREASHEHFSASFAQLKTLGARTRASVLRPEEGKYALDPSTRYRTLNSASGTAAAVASTI
mmetsp:Transcript_76676/g.248171  ORF Transcript_76676/g.248171 Transcript_76676/m.248171 type:complete len:935 (+) Transcript_76676:45-2849(+)